MSHHEREVIGVDDRVSPARAIPLGIQHMMSMFGSTVLVPVLTGLDPNVAIMCSGIGTICYLLVTGNKIPSYLGSSFVKSPLAQKVDEHVLDEVGAAEQPAVTVYNKIDRLDPSEIESLKRREPEAVFFSAVSGEGKEELLNRIIHEASACDAPISCEIPYREGLLLSSIRTQGNILIEEYLEDRIRLVCKVPRHIAARVNPYVTE